MLLSRPLAREAFGGQGRDMCVWRDLMARVVSAFLPLPWPR
jgi:hypothetical protein